MIELCLSHGDFYLYPLFILGFCNAEKCPDTGQSNQTRVAGSWSIRDTEIQQNLFQSNLPCESANAPGKLSIRLGKAIDPAFHAYIVWPRTSAPNTFNSRDFRKDYWLSNSLMRVDAIRAYGCFCWEVYSGVEYTGSNEVLYPGCQINLTMTLGSFKRANCEAMKLYV